MDNSSFNQRLPVINILKKQDFPLRIEPFFTGFSDPFDLIPWREFETADGETSFEAPGHWSDEVVASFASACACASIPAATRTIEENTVPSWLWRRQTAISGQSGVGTAETRARQIFHRVAGAAAYAGWKQGIFAEEIDAKNFFDEIRALLAQRYIGLQLELLAKAGLDWAYGIEKKSARAPVSRAAVAFESGATSKKNQPVDIRNSSIDALLGGDEKISGKWDKLVSAGAKDRRLQLRFVDIAAEWSAASDAPQAAAIDLFAFRREDGALDVEKLGHAAYLLAILLELLGGAGGAGKAIGFYNLAPLLMSRGLAYDSDAGRATAAALAAIITSEACVASALLAALLGPSLDFAANREGILRALRNHRRAAYGEGSDYEKVSVLPAPLLLDPGTDIALIAAARHRWDKALELARQHGLRATQFTALTPSLELRQFMESASAGIDAMPSLILSRAIEPDLYRREIHTAVTEALFKLDYDTDARAAIIHHIAGAGTLAHAAGIDHAALRRKGFDDRALEEIELYLPYVNDIRLAFTPWIAGEEFYRDTLKISAEKIRDPRFDVLQALGFTVAAIEAANAFVYGSGSAQGAKALKPSHVPVLARADEIAAEAHIRMAAAVQSFVSGETGLTIALDAQSSRDKIGRMLLAAWRQGVKSVTLELIDRKASASTVRPRIAMPKAQKPVAPTQPYGVPLRSVLHSKPKAQGKLVSMKRGRADKPDRPGKT